MLVSPGHSPMSGLRLRLFLVLQLTLKLLFDLKHQGWASDRVLAAAAQGRALFVLVCSSDTSAGRSANMADKSDGQSISKAIFPSISKGRCRELNNVIREPILKTQAYLGLQLQYIRKQNGERCNVLHIFWHLWIIISLLGKNSMRMFMFPLI